MFFGRKTKRRTSLLVGFGSGLAFLWLAVYGWGLPPEKVGSFFLVSVLLLALLIILALIFSLVIVLLRKLGKRNKS